MKTAQGMGQSVEANKTEKQQVAKAIYIYIYIQREREREREIWGFGQWAIKQEEKERHRFGVKS